MGSRAIVRAGRHRFGGPEAARAGSVLVPWRKNDDAEASEEAVYLGGGASSHGQGERAITPTTLVAEGNTTSQSDYASAMLLAEA
jgi:hypothetical protein